MTTSKDPENHRDRQRELISELDEARKEIEKGSRKRKWNFFGRKQDPTKNDWETYDLDKETTATGATAKGTGGTANGDNAGVLFDIDAIRAEIEASSKEPQVVELESTMPKLRISIDGGGGLRPPARDGLRHTKSFDDGEKHSSSPTKEELYKGRGYGYDSFELEEHDEAAGEGEIRLEFDPEPEPDSRRRAGSLPPSARPTYGCDEASGDGAAGGGAVVATAGGGRRTNVWADYGDDDYDDEFAPRRRNGGEEEMTMTFA